MLNAIENGYIKTSPQGEPTFLIERCPPELAEDMGNVIAMMPVRRMEVIEVSIADLILERAMQIARERQK